MPDHDFLGMVEAILKGRVYSITDYPDADTGQPMKVITADDIPYIISEIQRRAQYEAARSAGDVVAELSALRDKRDRAYRDVRAALESPSSTLDDEENGRDAVLTAKDEEAAYIIAGPDSLGTLQVDWDGEIHADLDKARRELAECHRSGYPDYDLFEIRRVRAALESTLGDEAEEVRDGRL